jgi:hypothetical protein
VANVANPHRGPDCHVATGCHVPAENDDGNPPAPVPVTPADGEGCPPLALADVLDRFAVAGLPVAVEADHEGVEDAAGVEVLGRDLARGAGRQRVARRHVLDRGEGRESACTSGSTPARRSARQPRSASVRLMERPPGRGLTSGSGRASNTTTS